MYSAILMTAMTLGGQSPTFHHGCFTCFGGCSNACYTVRVGCGGCGCYSACHGCSGCFVGCHGCVGCGCYAPAGCYAPSCAVPHGCHFVPAGGHVYPINPVAPCYGHSGHVGHSPGYQPSWGVGNSWLGGAGWYTDYGASLIKMPPADDDEDPKEDEKNGSENKENKENKGTGEPGSGEPKNGTGEPGSGDPEKLQTPKEEKKPTTAKLSVELPEDAKLFIDDQPTKSKSARRTFRTPELKPGAIYFYDLRVEVVRDGVPIIREKQIILKSGDDISASFDDIPTRTAAKAP